MRSGDPVIGTSTHTVGRESWTTAALGCVPVVRWCAALFQTVRTTLREIFDENAYDRYLQRTREARSVESYREFMREREAGLAKCPRCC
jgi:hypothetical protein